MNIACKGIAIKLGEQSAICFDTDLMRIAFGWSGGYLNAANTMLIATKGVLNPSVQGTLKFASSMGPGWSAEPTFKDPRNYGFGPLPKTQAHFKGLYLSGSRVILSYTVEGANVLELSSVMGATNQPIFTRTFHIASSNKTLFVKLCDRDKIEVVAHALGLPSGAELNTAGKTIFVKIPAQSKPATFTVALAEGTNSSVFSEALKTFEAPNLPALIEKDTPRYGEPIVTRGTLGEAKGAFALDSIALPEATPQRPWMRLTGIDFFPDGRAAVCNLDGDVWIVSGLDEKLEKVAWKRFAAGLFEPLGLRIVDEKIYVLGRDQITRLHDRDADGEADFYENFNNDGVASASYGGFAMDLQTDAQGNFYYGRSGHHSATDLPLNGGIYRISKDGSKLETVATGMRVPNGLGMGPNGELTFGDNEGNYVPASKISLVKPGGFYGFVHEPNPKQKVPATYEQPFLWLPKAMDTSSGSQEWIPKGCWGPLEGRMLHTSYGKAKLFLVNWNRNGQAAASVFPYNFDSGIMRGRFNAKDGQFYTCGLGGGWQAGGVKYGCLNRVRYTGKSLAFPIQVRATASGLELEFAEKLDAASAADVENYGAEQWNYRYSAAYGSPELKVSAPGKQGRDAVDIQSASVSADGKKVSLKIPGMQPVMQFMLKYKLKTASGEALNSEFYATFSKLE